MTSVATQETTTESVLAVVERLDALAHATTPLPWRVGHASATEVFSDAGFPDESSVSVAYCGHEKDPEKCANAAFIVALVNAWPSLCAALRQSAADRQDAERWEFADATRNLADNLRAHFKKFGLSSHRTVRLPREHWLLVISALDRAVAQEQTNHD